MNKDDKLFSANYVLLIVVNFFFAISFYALLSTLPKYLKYSLQFNTADIGIIMAAYTISSLLSRPFAGFITDKYNRRLVLTLSLILFSLNFLLYIPASLPWHFTSIRFLHGITWGFLTTATTTIIFEILPVNKRGMGIGLAGFSMTLAMAISPVVAVELEEFLGMNFMLIFSTIIAVISMILSFWITVPLADVTNKTFRLREMISGKVLPVSFAMFFACISYGSIISFAIVYAATRNIDDPGIFFIFLATGLMVSRFYSGKLFDKHGPYWIIISGYAFVLAGMVIFSFLNSKELYLSTGALLGLGFGTLMPAMQVMINNLVDNYERGAANSTFLTVFDLGIGLGMIFTGILSKAFDFTVAFNANAFLVLTGFIFFIFYVWKHYNICKKEG